MSIRATAVVEGLAHRKELHRQQSMMEEKLSWDFSLTKVELELGEGQGCSPPPLREAVQKPGGSGGKQSIRGVMGSLMMAVVASLDAIGLQEGFQSFCWLFPLRLAAAARRPGSEVLKSLPQMSWVFVTHVVAAQFVCIQSLTPGQVLLHCNIAHFQRSIVAPQQ